MRSRLLAVALAAVLAGAGLAAATPAQAATPAALASAVVTMLDCGADAPPIRYDCAYGWVIRHSQLCMHLEAPNYAHGTRYMQYYCTAGPGGHPLYYAQWFLHPVSTSSGTWYQIKGYNGLCMTLSGGTANNGNVLFQWTCAGVGHQLWRARQVSTTPVHWEFYSYINTARCIDQIGASPYIYEQFALWNCKGWAEVYVASELNQQFYLRRV